MKTKRFVGPKNVDYSFDIEDGQNVTRYQVSEGVVDVQEEHVDRVPKHLYGLGFVPAAEDNTSPRRPAAPVKDS